MFLSNLVNFRRKVVEPALDARMRAAGAAWQAEAQRLAPVDTGYLRSTINYSYNVAEKRLILAVDASYGLFLEFGTAHHAAHPFMRPAMSAIPLGFRGGVGSLFTGHTVELQAANVHEQYHDRIHAHAKARGRLRGAKLKLGHGRFR